MPLVTKGRNDLLTNGLTAFTHVGAFTDLGVTEVAGGTYARQAVTWAAAASGLRDNTAQLSIPIPASTTVPVIGIFDALTVGNVEAWMQIGSTLRGVGSVDTIANDTIQSDGHGLTNTNRVFVAPVMGEALPAGLSALVLYFVIGVTTDTFQLSLTSGGAAVDITGLNEFAWYRTVPETFSNAGTLVIVTGALDIDATAL